MVIHSFSLSIELRLLWRGGVKDRFSVGLVPCRVGRRGRVETRRLLLSYGRLDGRWKWRVGELNRADPTVEQIREVVRTDLDRW